LIWPEGFFDGTAPSDGSTLTYTIPLAALGVSPGGGRLALDHDAGIFPGPPGARGGRHTWPYRLP